MSTNYLVGVPKLKGRENYDEWAFAAENFMILEGLAKCIKNVVGTTGGVTVSAEEDQKAKAKLILCIEPSLYIHIKDASSTKELWDKLTSMFDDSGFTRRISLLRSLISMRLENCDSMGDYVNQIVETGQRLRGTGFKIDDEWIGSLLLAGLPEKYMPMIMAIEHSGVAITTDSIKTKLLDMEGDVGKTGTAFYSKHGNDKWQRQNTGRKSDKDKKDKKDISNVKSFRCKEFGHFQNKCTKDKKSESDKNKRQYDSAFNVVFLNGDFKKGDWYIDSGASAHLVTNENMLRNSSAEPETKEIMVANQNKIPVTASGEVLITTVVGEEKFDIIVQKVLCVPQLSTNLLSVRELVRKGNTVKFYEDCCKVFNKNQQLVAIAEEVNGVYKLNTFEE